MPSVTNRQMSKSCSGPLDDDYDIRMDFLIASRPKYALAGDTPHKCLLTSGQNGDRGDFRSRFALTKSLKTNLDHLVPPSTRLGQL